MALVKQDFGRLEDLRRRVGEVGSVQFREGLARRLAGTCTKLLADEFRQSCDPYGRPWAPVFRRRAKDRKARQRAYLRASRAGKDLSSVRDKPLLDTGRLRAAATASQLTQGTTVRVVIPVEYASYHQYGTRHIRQRQIIPMLETGGLGPIWTEAFRKEMVLALKQAMAEPGGGS